MDTLERSELARAVLKPPADLPEGAVQVVTEVRTGEYDEPGYACAVVTLTPARASLLLKRIRQLRDLGEDAFSARFWDSSADFVVSIDDEDEPEIYERLEGRVSFGEETAVLRGDECVTLLSGILYSEDAWLIAYSMAIVYKDSVVFEASYKHCPGGMNTADIPLELIEEVAGEKVEG